MGKLRVLVVEDSLTVRMRLCEAIEEDAGFEVAGEAADGVAAVERCKALRPDVVTLDMELPGMNGVEVTQRIMADCATPILVVSASVNRGHALDTFDALQAGAVEVLDKSRVGQDPEWAAKLRALLRQVARIRVISRPWGREPPRSPRPQAPARAEVLGAGPPAEDLRIVAIGASTGGPGAIAQVLGALPASFPLPIAVVLHVAPLFGEMMVSWLKQRSALPVIAASDGALVPPPGRRAAVFVAPPDRHLVVSEGRLRLTDAPEVHSCRPSVDVLFASVAREYGKGSVGCLLTGMGRDGAAGLLAMRRAGARTLAQDEATSTVFGMPREAIALGAAEQIRPIDEIGPSIIGLTSGGPSRSTPR